MKTKKLMLTIFAFLCLIFSHKVSAKMLINVEFSRIGFQADSMVDPNDTFTMFKLIAYNNFQVPKNGFDSTRLYQVHLSFLNSGIDEVFLYDGKKLVGSAKVYDWSPYGYIADIVDLSYCMLVSHGVSRGTVLRVVCKISPLKKNMGNLLVPVNDFHRCFTRTRNARTDPAAGQDIRNLFSSSWYTRITTVSVKLNYAKNNNKKIFCLGDSMSIWAGITGKKYLIKEEWFINNKNISKESLKFIILDKPAKILVVVTDSFAREFKDSLEFTVSRKPKINLSFSGYQICDGDSVEVSLDTNLLGKWHCNEQSFSKGKIKLFNSKTQRIEVSSKDGCYNDTSFSIVVFPVQEHLIISSHDSVLRVNKNAYSIKWIYNDVIFDSSKQIITRKQSGFYTVHATNKFGCSSYSKPFWFSYVISKDLSRVKIYPNPAVDKFIIRSDFGEARAELIDFQGQLVRYVNIEKDGYTVVNRGDLASGLYFLRLGSTSAKIVFHY